MKDLARFTTPLRQCVVALAAAAALAVAPPAAADAVEAWRLLTRADVDAAYRLLLEDHPAGSRELDDAGFRQTLREAYRIARERAGQVVDYDGYAATMAGFANAMGDRHIYSRPLYRRESLNWAGLVMMRRGERYVVALDERAGAEAGADLTGSRLISCDGRSADAFAEQKLGGFRAVWSIEAQRIQAAPYLLVDDGNPFVLRPESCVFEKNARQIETPLNWLPVSRADLRAHVRPALGYGAAGFGVRPFAGGYWIALQALDDRAQEVVRDARENAAHLRRAPIVVLDLRGNGGGSVVYGRQIAEIIFGERRVSAALGPNDYSSCMQVWRLSARNMARLRDYVVRYGSSPAFGEIVRRMLDNAEAALAQGKELSGPARCEAPRPAAGGALPQAAARGRMVVLTDNACFSSCLLVVDEFRRLGALHVGDVTNANTHFGEVREDLLPSGLTMFSTLQTVSPDLPRNVGPFEPHLRFEGAFDDTQSLEAWIGRTAAHEARTSR